ncbi:hypothetical protein [Ciceribacter thiooxidans]|uniref:Transmembrane protein n=1 Tax=Ciceribacter thiooxidans TaxID=1969821 RepID=A0ABV7I6L5_9HYPH|nr:hypothetical protein [Ciceribacter thiooxidans]
MKEPVEEISVTRAMLMILAGPILWAGHFAFAYGTHTLACASAISPQAVPWTIGIATLLVVVLLAVIVWEPTFLRRAAAGWRRDRFLSNLSRMLAVLSMTGILWAGWAALEVDVCAQLR